MLFDLKNKVAIITGGGSGIGKAIAEVFAEQGAQVCILELTSKLAKESAQALTNQRLLAKGYTRCKRFQWCFLSHATCS